MNDALYDTLFYGYYFDEDPKLPRYVYEGIRSEEFNGEDKNDLVSEGIGRFRGAIEEKIDEQEGEMSQHVVPLSGGLDSRAVLSGLLEYNAIEDEEITTITFGSPGTWDYEIGQTVADHAGVKNVAVNLATVTWSEERLSEYFAKHRPRSRVLESYLNYIALTEAIDARGLENPTIWSGFLGETLAGNHLPKEASDSWEEAISYFTEFNRFVDRATLPEEYDPKNRLPSEPYIDPESVRFEDQLDLAVRQQYFTRPIIEQGGFDYVQPFKHPHVLSFYLNLPEEYRLKRTLTKEMFLEMDRELFSLPSTATNGLGLHRHWMLGLANKALIKVKTRVTGLNHPNMNYVDFEALLESEESVRVLIEREHRYLESNTRLELQSLDQETSTKYLRSILVASSVHRSFH